MTADEPTRHPCCPCCEPGVDQGGYTERDGHEQPCPYDHDRPFDPSDLEGD